MAVVLPYSLKNKRVWVAGQHGMVGSALARRLKTEECELLNVSRKAIDFRNQALTKEWINRNRPDVILMAAAKVGGIAANAASPATFLYDNIMIEANIIHAAYESEVERLVLLGSTCIYPKLAQQPIPEDALLTGPLEETNQWYAIAKIAGLKMIEAYRKQYGVSYIACQPTNLYGPGDNYDLKTSHVLPALLRKAYEARKAQAPTVTVWGSGAPLREFLHVDDLADAVIFLLKNYDQDTAINIGSGQELSIKELAVLICKVTKFSGELRFDNTKPDGHPRKLTDCTRLLELGWKPRIKLEEGLHSVYNELLEHLEHMTGSNDT